MGIEMGARDGVGGGGGAERLRVGAGDGGLGGCVNWEVSNQKYLLAAEEACKAIP